ncbi:MULTISPECIES: hypothetical protein [unclassified Streptomyces]|nr:hypothetical protein [Streptomyces sp. CB01580]
MYDRTRERYTYDRLTRARPRTTSGPVLTPGAEHRLFENPA